MSQREVCDVCQRDPCTCFTELDLERSYTVYREQNVAPIPLPKYLRLRDYVEQLEVVVMELQHAVDEDGPCWCMYFTIVHSDPDDTIDTRDGHTETCWKVRALYKNYKGLTNANAERAKGPR